MSESAIPNNSFGVDDFTSEFTSGNWADVFFLAGSVFVEIGSDDNFVGSGRVAICRNFAADENVVGKG